MLYDVDVITWLRKSRRILGVLIGTLPQIPQQNVFLGLPLELQPEEARLLVDEGSAYIVDDLEIHRNGLCLINPAQRDAFRQKLIKEGKEAARAAERKKQERTENALKKLHQKEGAIAEGTTSASTLPGSEIRAEEDESLFIPSPAQEPKLSSRPSVSSVHGSDVGAWSITTTRSYPPLPPPPNNPKTAPPEVNPSSYAIFKHLHNLLYFISPGLRFGCQFLIYPGDPLRFHSHFLAISADWNEEINLVDLVGGGRLGTGVKKGWLIGGVEKNLKSIEYGGDGDLNMSSSKMEVIGSERLRDKDSQADPRVRTFCIEWGGM